LINLEHEENEEKLNRSRRKSIISLSPPRHKKRTSSIISDDEKQNFVTVNLKKQNTNASFKSNGSKHSSETKNIRSSSVSGNSKIRKAMSLVGIDSSTDR